MRVSLLKRYAVASAEAQFSSSNFETGWNSTSVRPGEEGKRTEDAVESDSSGTSSDVLTSSSPNSATTSNFSSDLLGYPIRRAAACELLYGGIRIRHLVQPVFPLQWIRSENLPSPSLQVEREDLGLEMQMPSHKDATQVPSYRIHGQVPSHTQANYDDGLKDSLHDGFNMGQFFNDLFHPSLHHNSSPPYNPATNTNNVLALRLFPVNIGIRDRTEAIRLRTQDCLVRLQHWKLTARLGLPTQYPLPLRIQKALRQEITRIDTAGKPRSLYSGALDPRRCHTSSTLPALQHGTQSIKVNLPSASTYASPGTPLPPTSTQASGSRTISIIFLPHMKGKLHFHPSPSSLSIFTVPGEGNDPSWKAEDKFGNGELRKRQGSLLPSSAGRASSRRRSSWMPFQMLKPMGYNWSPSRRSSGNRGPSAQLVQERLDQKGFGWKRKSRYLWQQDIDTAGFRPHRFY